MRRFAPETALITVTIVWGMTFVVMRHAMTMTGPLIFVALRFGLASLLLGAFAHRRMAGLTWAELRAGCAIGATITAGYGLQAAGLQTIPASMSAFITALYVPIVPLLQWLALGRPPRPASWAGIALATMGLVLLAGPAPGQVALGRGEVLTILCAIAVAAEVILIGHFAPRVDAMRVTVVQMAVAAILAALVMPLAGEAVALPRPQVLGIAAVLAVTSAVIQLTMNWAQRSLSPTRATLIYAGEPVWAGLFGRLAGERLTPAAILGAGLIVAGVVVAEWRWRRR